MKRYLYFVKDGKTGPRVVGAGLYAWMYNKKVVVGDRSRIIYIVEKGVMLDGQMHPESKNEEHEVQQALRTFREARQMIQKLVAREVNPKTWPDTVI